MRKRSAAQSGRTSPPLDGLRHGRRLNPRQKGSERDAGRTWIDYHPPMGHRSILLGILLLAGLGTAQQRRPFFATVLGGDGVPIAGAKVTCVFSPDLVKPWSTDVVVATTDERGRARCELIVGRIYRAWSVGGADATGACAVTAPVDLVAAGRVLELRSCTRRAPRRLRITGAPAWREVGVVGLRWFPDAISELCMEVNWCADDVVEIPPSPDAVGCLALVDKAGQIVTNVSLAPTATDPVAFAKPMLVEAIVTGADGAPLAGAVVEQFAHRAGNTRRILESGVARIAPKRLCGKTGADGRLKFHAPTPASAAFLGRVRQQSLVLFAHKPGFSMQPTAASEAGTVRFQLEAQASVSLRVKADTDDVLTVAAQGNFMLRPDRSSLIFGFRSLTLRREGQGRWSVPAQAFMPRIAIDSRIPTAAVSNYFEDVDQAVTVDLDSLATVAVRVLDVDGGPIPCAVAVSRVTEGFPVYWDAALASDLAGKASLRLPQDAQFFVYATTGTAHGLSLVDATQKEPVVVQLAPLPTMRIKVCDAKGQPIGGASIRGHQSSYRSMSGDDLGQQWDRLASELWWAYAQVRSDAHGVMVVPAFIRDGLTAEIVVEQGGRSSGAFKLVPDQEREITLGK